MSRRKIPSDETTEETSVRKVKEAISNNADRSEKTSWNRKMDNMVTLMSKLTPIEEEIIELQTQKQPVFDEIQRLRELMVKECVHPFEYLSVQEDFTECKFCNKKIKLNNATTKA